MQKYKHFFIKQVLYVWVGGNTLVISKINLFNNVTVLLFFLYRMAKKC